MTDSQFHDKQKQQKQKQAWVSRILPFSCVDGPGNRLVIFLQGCNFNCITCHNPHTIHHCNHCGECVASCPSNALSLINHKVSWQADLCTHCDQCIDVCRFQSSPKVMHYSVDQLLAIIKKQQAFISGITLSGGEATLQLPFIIELFRSVKQDQQLHHLTCFVDSNGYLSQVGWEKLMPYLDGVMIDLKSWQNETHQWLVGRDNHKVMASIQLLANHNKLYELRFLHIPGKSDLDSEVTQVAQFIRTLPNDVKIRLNAFQHHGVVGEALSWPKCTPQQLEVFRSKLADLIDQPIIVPAVYT